MPRRSAAAHAAHARVAAQSRAIHVLVKHPDVNEAKVSGHPARLAPLLTPERVETLAGDIIADLLYLADLVGLDPARLLDRARSKYEEVAEMPARVTFAQHDVLRSMAAGRGPVPTVPMTSRRAAATLAALERKRLVWQSSPGTWVLTWQGERVAAQDPPPHR